MKMNDLNHRGSGALAGVYISYNNGMLYYRIYILQTSAPTAVIWIVYINVILCDYHYDDLYISFISITRIFIICLYIIYSSLQSSKLSETNVSTFWSQCLNPKILLPSGALSKIRSWVVFRNSCVLIVTSDRFLSQ